jgi:hypothetical protein
LFVINYFLTNAGILFDKAFIRNPSSLICVDISSLMQALGKNALPHKNNVHPEAPKIEKNYPELI